MADPHRVLSAIAQTIQSPAPSTGRIVSSDGFSGAALMDLLAHLTEVLCDSKNAYTEIGVYRGLTLSMVASRSQVPCVGIDDFSLFNADASNRSAVEQRLADLGCQNAVLVDLDFEVALREWRNLAHGAEAIGVLFVDGPHDYRSQLMALLLGRPSMRQGGVIVVDDANYAHVRQASYDFLAAFPDWGLVVEITTPGHPDVVTPEQHADARIGWWNGIHVLQHDPSGELPRLQPLRVDISQHVASHDVFRHRFGLVALDALNGFLKAEVQLPDREAAGETLLATLDRLASSAGQRAASQNTETTAAVEIRVATAARPSEPERGA